MKKSLNLILLLGILVLFPSFHFLNASETSSKLKGKILLQVESNGEAWYVYPDNEKRYYLGRPDDALRVMRELGLGVSNKDFNSFKNLAPKRLSGKILLKIEDSGKAYYVNPTDLKIHYLGRPADAFSVMWDLGIGISNKDLEKISIADTSKKVSTSLLDSDADGLTDVEEVKLGTNKYKADTDGDLVNDKHDEHPLDVGAKINKAFQVTDSYYKKYTISINIPVDYYLYYKNHMPHDMGKNYENITKFVTGDDYYLKQIFIELNKLNNRLRDESIAQKGYNDTLVISGIDEIFRQNLYNYDINTGFDEYPKYPIETIVEGAGDCEDLSFLFASLMLIESNGWNEWAGAGKKVALIRYPSHLAVGIAFPQEDWYLRYKAVADKYGTALNYFEHNSYKYLYQETTNSDFKLGEMPEDLLGKNAYLSYLN